VAVGRTRSLVQNLKVVDRRLVIVLAHFRCFFLDILKACVGSESFDANNDDAAMQRVASLIRERGYHSVGFELWQDARLVHRQEPIDRKS